MLIALIKNTTIASAIGVGEAALLMKGMIENEAALLVIGTIFAIGFVILTLPTGLVLRVAGQATGGGAVMCGVPPACGGRSRAKNRAS